MENGNAQLLVGATSAVGLFEVILYLKNLNTAKSSLAPQNYEGLKDEDFIALRNETVSRCRYEIIGAIMNCGILAIKIHKNYYPIIWQFISEKFGRGPFITYWIFQLTDAVINNVIFGIVTSRVSKRLRNSGRGMRCLAMGHSNQYLPLGFMFLLIMIFIPDVNPKLWFFLPILSTFDGILNEGVKNRHCKRLITSQPNSGLTNRVKDAANLLEFHADNIYINPKEVKIPVLDYFGNWIVVSENLLSLPEEIATVLISQEMALSTRSTVLILFMAAIRWAGLGYMLVTSFGNNEICEVFGFDNSPYPYVPMYLAYAYVWPVFSQSLNRVQCLVHSWKVLQADTVVHKAITTQGANALKMVAGKAEMFPIFDTWYSQLMRGYPTVARRLKNLNAHD